MADSFDDEEQDRFHWTPGKIMLAELGVLCVGIIGLVPIMFMGISLSAAKERAVPWWFHLMDGDILLIVLAAMSLPVTALIAFILRLARDE